MTALTRTHLDALTELHLSGALAPADHAYRRATLDALVVARVASYDVYSRVYRPTIHTYADGYGLWHAVVPYTVARHEGASRRIARAVIAGEVWARSRASHESRWRPRVMAPPYLSGDAAIDWREAR
jgi:hypothetical protein